MNRKPTIHEALAAKLGREPTHEEIKADVLRILREARNEREIDPFRRNASGKRRQPLPLPAGMDA